MFARTAIAGLMLALLTTLPAPPASANSHGPVTRAGTVIVIAAADRCRSTISAHGEAGGYAPGYFNRQLARVRAITKWRSKVEDTHGPTFGTWYRARDRNIQCEASLGTMHCIAEAAPCVSNAAGFFF